MLTQELLADIHMVSRATVSRVVTAYTPLVAEVLRAWVPDAEDLDPDLSAYSLTAPLVSCWSWARAPRTVHGRAQGHGGEPAGGLHPGQAPRLDPSNHQRAVFMMRRSSWNPDSSQPRQSKSYLGQGVHRIENITLPPPLQHLETAIQVVLDSPSLTPYG